MDLSMPATPFHAMNMVLYGQNVIERTEYSETGHTGAQSKL